MPYLRTYEPFALISNRPFLIERFDAHIPSPLWTESSKRTDMIKTQVLHSAIEQIPKAYMYGCQAHYRTPHETDSLSSLWQTTRSSFAFRSQGKTPEKKQEVFFPDLYLALPWFPQLVPENAWQRITGRTFNVAGSALGADCMQQQADGDRSI